MTTSTDIRYDLDTIDGKWMYVHIFLYVRWCICLDTVCLELNFLNSHSNPMKQNEARIANIKYWQCGELSPMVWPPSSISLQSWASLHPHQSSPTVCLMKTYQQQNLQVDIISIEGCSEITPSVTNNHWKNDNNGTGLSEKMILKI